MYKIFQNKKTKKYHLFYLENNKIMFYSIYKNKDKLYISLLRKGFSPIKMEWHNNLIHDLWCDATYDYREAIKEIDYTLLEDGEFVFMEDYFKND